MRKIKYKKGRKVQAQLLEYTGIHQLTTAELQLFVYDSDHLTEYNDFKISQFEKYIDPSKNNWLNLHGLNDESIIQSIGNFLTVDNFMLSDIVNTTKHSKLEEYKDVIFFNIKSILPVENSDNVQVEQISFLLKKDILVSFQEKRSDFFMHVRERIRTHSGLVRDKKLDYLLFLLLDAVMENFYITLENEENRVEALINLTKTNTQLQLLERIEKHRDNFNFLKRSIIPLRDSLYSIKSMKEDSLFNIIEAENFTFFSRLHQKSIELLVQIEYDLLSLESATNFYFSTQNHKLNEVMKTLTVVSVFFMPLTFIVGVYGMNFEFMPELHWKYGYFIILTCMLVLLLGMIYYFKKKKWY
ncbi:magnesium/cobalt transporter CorA [Flavobacterium sp.]